MDQSDNNGQLVHCNQDRALALLEVLGLKPEDHVVSVKLTMTAKDFVTVEIERYVTPGQFDQLVTELKSYKLVPKEQA